MKTQEVIDYLTHYGIKEKVDYFGMSDKQLTKWLKNHNSKEYQEKIYKQLIKKNGKQKPV